MNPLNYICNPKDCSEKYLKLDNGIVFYAEYSIETSTPIIYTITKTLLQNPLGPNTYNFFLKKVEINFDTGLGKTNIYEKRMIFPEDTYFDML